MSEFKERAQQEIAPNDNVVPNERRVIDAPPAEKKNKAAFFKLSATKKLTYMAIFAALAVVLKIFAITLSPTSRLTFFYIPVYLSGAVFGPFFGFFTGIVGDLVGFIISPTGAYNPVVTLGNGLSGLIFGLVFHFKLKPFIKIIIGSVLCLIIVSLGVNTIGMMLYNKEIAFTFTYYFSFITLGVPPRIVTSTLSVTMCTILIVPLYYAVRKHLRIKTAA